MVSCGRAENNTARKVADLFARHDVYVLTQQESPAVIPAIVKDRAL
jgi:hypothetical protein